MTQPADAGKPKAQPAGPGDVHVIVVEDNGDNLRIVMKLLELIGVRRVNWRTTGWQVVEFARALSRFGERRPDLILLDIGLPGEDGYAVLAALRADADLKDTRVAAVTVHNAPADMQRARAAGFDAFIGKPIQAERFPDQIRRILAGESVWEP